MNRRNREENEGPSRRSKLRKIKQVGDEDRLEQLKQEANAADALAEKNSNVEENTNSALTVFLVVV